MINEGQKIQQNIPLSAPHPPLSDRYGLDGSAGDEAHSTRVVGNILSLATSEVGARVIAFAGIAYLARTLGPTAFGIIGFATALWAYLSLAVTAGFNDIGAREIARRPREAPAIAASVALVRLALAVVASIAIGVLVLFLNKPSTVRIVILLSSLLFFPLALDTSWVHKGLERNARVGVALLVGHCLYVGMILLLVHRPQDVVYVPVAQFFGEISGAVLLAVPILAISRTTLNLHEGLRILKSSGYLTLARFLRTFIFSSDVVLLGFLLGERAVGLYNAPYRLCYLLLAMSVAIHAAYLPAMTRASAVGFTQMRAMGGRSMELAAALGIPLTVGGMLLAVPLLNTVFGPDYIEGAAAFRLLLLSIGFIFFSGVTHNLLLASDRLRVEMWIIAGAAVLNVGFILILIPRYGLVGAAFSTALAEGVILFLTMLSVSRLGIRPSFRSITRPAFAALVMGASILGLGRQQNLALSLVVGTAVFVVVLAAVRGMPRDVEIYLGGFTALRTAVYERFPRRAKTRIMQLRLRSTRPLARLRARLRRAWHFWRGPNAQQIADAQNALRGREYYHLYDDRYHDAALLAGQHGGLIAQDDVRRRVYLEFDRLRRTGLIPEPSARLIDLGCGQGDVAMQFTQLGYRASGVDVSPVAIQHAMRLAVERAQHVDFFVGDVLDLSGIPDASFDIATDIGCLHMLVQADHRRRYLMSLAK
jgi:O-antigen/teichoic acid export membrane protein/2-polyprenyl-3-methyl-5-hydroxy-6-metoxy-1,4-benzoquinol methylase